MSETFVVSQAPAAVPAGLVDGLRAFHAQHTGATATIEHAGRKGALIVLVGGDGAATQRPAPGTDVARAACQQAGVPVHNGWMQDLAG